MDMLGIGMDLMSIMVTFVIIIGVLLGKKKKMNEYFPVLLLLNAITLIADMGVYTFRNDAANDMIFRVCWVSTFGFLMCEIGCLNLYVDKLLFKEAGKKHSFRTIPFILLVALVGLWVASYYTGWFFEVSESGVYSMGSFFWIAEVGGCFVVVIDMLRIISNHLTKKLDGTSAWGMYLFIMIPLGAMLISESLGYYAILFAGYTISFLIMFISIHVKQEQTALEKEAVNEKLERDIILSQLQPHFLFNSLTTIKYLCNTNNHLATEAITKFTKYLRKNLDVIEMDSMQLVPFNDELKHVEIYIWLEQLRFGNNLNVEYDIEAEYFNIPPLTIQPIVENAIKHGIQKKIGGGTVWISTTETDKYYRIEIKDDGIGYDTLAVMGDAQKCTGITNVRKRISQLNNSTVEVRSKPEFGTTVVYHILKE